MKAIKYLIIGLLAFSSYLIKAQQFPKVDINFDDYIQQVSSTNQEDIDFEAIYESLYQLYQNPIDINFANVDELRSLFLLSETQIQNILNHRNNFGNFLSIYELQAVPEMDLESIRKILPFIKLGNSLKNINPKQLFKNPTEHFLLFRIERSLQESQGFENNSYLGDKNRIYTRYKYAHPNDFNIGFISEKDAGEKNFFDYTSFNIQLKNKGNFKNIIIGDYQLQFGQGLVTAAGFSAGKGAETIYTIRRSNIGIKPYNSLIENGNFRGISATYQLGLLEISPWISKNQRDGIVNSSEIDTLQIETFTGIQTSGFHRTANELSRKDQISETNLGINGLFRFQRLQIGITAMNTAFDKNLLKRDELYNAYEFTGKKNLVISSNFSYSYQNFNTFGEIAHSSSGGIGLIAGIMGTLSKQIEWALSFRSYDKDFHSFYAVGFAESSRTINEKGVYSGIKFTPKKGFVFSFFYDQFKFPWLKYLIDAPSIGNEYAARASFQPNKKQLLYFQMRNETKQKNKPNHESNTNVLVNQFHSIYMINYEHIITNKLKSQSRIQHNTSQYEGSSKSKGWLIMQDLEGQFNKYTWRARAAYYRVDDYNSRIYAYENDVLYAVSFPAYFGNGFRFYLVNKYAISNKIDLWLRLASTFKPKEESIGSGLDKTNNAQKTDFKLQIRYTFK